MRKINYILSIIFSISISFLNIHASEKCEYKVKKLHNALLGNSQSEQNFKENFLKLRDINSVIFDSKKMIRIIYGRKWKKLEENQKEELQLKFLDFLTYNYVKRFRNMNEAYFTEKKIENIDEKRILIKTELNIKGENPIEISYLCSKNNVGDWKIFDVILKGSISEISTKKSDFSSIIDNEGADGLIKTLDSKIIFD